MRKQCQGCMMWSDRPSPVCTSLDKMRDWEYNDLKGGWDKHCVSVWRTRYMSEHPTLSQFELWLRQDPKNRAGFLRHLIAYYSLRIDPCFTSRLSAAAIDYRASMLDLLQRWRVEGDESGVPAPQVSITMPLASAESVIGSNPLLAGGRAVVMTGPDGRRTVGVTMPDATPRGSPVVAGDMCDSEKASLLEVVDRITMTVEDEASIATFRQAFAEFHETRMAMATASGEPVDKRFNLSAEASSPACLALALRPGASGSSGEGAQQIVPLRRLKSSAALSIDGATDCPGDSAPDDSQHTTPKKKTDQGPEIDR